MDDLFYEFFELLIKLEGEDYSDNKFDRGGKTKFGITQYLIDNIARINKTEPIDLKLLTQEQAKSIYYDEFYTKVKKVNNSETHYNLFDMAVNSGYGNYRIMLRKLEDNKKLDNISDIYIYRENFFKDIVKNDQSQNSNIKGWLNRLNKIKNHFKLQKDNFV